MPSTSTTGQTVPFHDHIAIDVLDAPPGSGRVAIPDRRELQNHLGTVHGAMLYAVGEIAAASAMVRLLGEDFVHLRAITCFGSIKYLKPARGAVTGESHIALTHQEIIDTLDAARSMVVPIDVALTDDAGRVVAELEIKFHLSWPKDTV